MTASGDRLGASLAEVSFLVVDHKAMERDMVHAALRGRARKVSQTTNIDKAIEILTAPKAGIDCVIVDWDMPPVGGLELLRMIRCRVLPNVSPRTPVVIFTSRPEEAVVRCAVELDANGFAAAPLSLDKLVHKISSAVSRTWLLQDVAHYASVPCVVSSPISEDTTLRAASTSVASRSGPFQHIQGTRRTHSIRMCGLKDVRPGAILARDITDIHGTLLLRTGTTLQPAAISRLRKGAGSGANRCHVWVRT